MTTQDTVRPGTLPYSRPVADRLPHTADQIEVRFLRADDIERLLVLEHAKWTEEQAARPEDMAQRMAANPTLCFGAFSRRTSEALASMFLKPIGLDQLRAANTWADCARVESSEPLRTRSMFGISITSVDQVAVDSILEFFWPIALKGGWREIYGGATLPGLRAWKRANPDTPVEEYVHAKRNGRPIDPQMFYYHEKGFTRIVACKPDYFPHERSLDYGAVLRAGIPLSAWAPLWRIVPLSLLRRLTRVLRHMK